jgi:hypothetical protein
MESIITGDIINSRAVIPEKWLPLLKGALNKFGREPGTWEIFRGDSFQLRINPETAVEAALLLKASIKQFKELDVRIAIGIGEIDYYAEKITASNGSAFLRSGECFEQLRKQNLAIKSSSSELDESLNIKFELASFIMNGWSPVTSSIVKTALENPGVNQKELAAILGISQSNISRGLKRAGYEEIRKIINYYRGKMNSL